MLVCILKVAPFLHAVTVKQLQYYVGIVTQEAVAISVVPDGALQRAGMASIKTKESHLLHSILIRGHCIRFMQAEFLL